MNIQQHGVNKNNKNNKNHKKIKHNSIDKSLTKLFEKYRIVFWYDDNGELQQDFEQLTLSGVEKRTIANNEFSLKYEMLKQQPKAKFLLYKNKPEPESKHNWLLDLQLYSAVFAADRPGLILSELGLPAHFKSALTQHIKFFSPSRQQQLAVKLADYDETEHSLRLKMLAIACNCEPELPLVLESLLQEASDNKDAKYRLIVRSQLNDFLWHEVQQLYGYGGVEPTIKGFALSVLQYGYFMAMNEPTRAQPTTTKADSPSAFTMKQEAALFLKRWQDMSSQREAFEYWSDLAALVLNVESDLKSRSLKQITGVDYFQVIDQTLLRVLTEQVMAKTISTDQVLEICRKRQHRCWRQKYSAFYQAIAAAGEFIGRLDRQNFDCSSADAAVRYYSAEGFKLDQLYRQFYFAYDVGKKPAFLAALMQMIENSYLNNFLIKCNAMWQHHVDHMQCWQVSGLTAQQDFFKTFVQPQLNKNKKVVVIISDALRFEAAEELGRNIHSENRYLARLKPMLSALPSYTQLGMASLLPTTEPQRIAYDKDATVFSGEQSTSGTDNRDKLLKKALKGRAVALTSERFMQKTSNERRQLIKNNDVLYLYHNQIDKVGDSKDSEQHTFRAVADTFDTLQDLVKKVTNANGGQIIITADHGFTFQYTELADSDFLDIALDKEYRNRRFIIGKNLVADKNLKIFQAQQLGQRGDYVVAIPKGMQRLRVSGAGSRFVHGGASLQEVIVPVIEVSKQRKEDVSKVEVQVISRVDVITTGQLAVMCYQMQPISEKVKGRTLKIGIYFDEILISDEHEVTFNMSSDNSRNRELKLTFILSRDADQANEQEVQLKLREKIANTHHYSDYVSKSYRLRRRISGGDFDF